MKLKEGSVLYVRTDYKIGDKMENEKDGQDTMEYLQGVAQERYLLAGVFGNMETEEIGGAMIIFEAQDLAEAQKICDNDPIIKRGFYRYELNQWNVMILSKDTGK